jgi:hypothetical protein
MGLSIRRRATASKQAVVLLLDEGIFLDACSLRGRTNDIALACVTSTMTLASQRDRQVVDESPAPDPAVLEPDIDGQAARVAQHGFRHHPDTVPRALVGRHDVGNDPQRSVLAERRADRSAQQLQHPRGLPAPRLRARARERATPAAVRLQLA